MSVKYKEDLALLKALRSLPENRDWRTVLALKEEEIKFCINFSLGFTSNYS